MRALLRDDRLEGIAGAPTAVLAAAGTVELPVASSLDAHTIVSLMNVRSDPTASVTSRGLSNESVGIGREPVGTLNLYGAVRRTGQSAFTFVDPPGAPSAGWHWMWVRARPGVSSLSEFQIDGVGSPTTSTGGLGDGYETSNFRIFGSDVIGVYYRKLLTDGELVRVARWLARRYGVMPPPPDRCCSSGRRRDYGRAA